MQFVLIDFENVQPSNLDGLTRDAHRIRVFVGASQSKISFETARALQAFGDAAEYVQITGSGRNALDFHIAYHLGRLSIEHPRAQFTIVSKDTGFDPLVKHMTAQGHVCRRVASIGAAAPAAPRAEKPAPKAKPAKTPAAKAAAATIGDDIVKAALERLRGMRSARPRTLKTLASSVKAWHKLDDAGVAALITALKASEAVVVDGRKVAYKFA
jgi:hypothetical protein